MKRTIARLVEAPLAEMILRGELARGDVAARRRSGRARVRRAGCGRQQLRGRVKTRIRPGECPRRDLV